MRPRVGALRARFQIAIICWLLAAVLAQVSWAGPATHFSVSAPSVSAPAFATAGSAFGFTVTALDSANAVDTGYSGLVNVTSSDPQFLPFSFFLTNGVRTSITILWSAGFQTITARDSVNSLLTGNSGSITVVAGAALRFPVSAPASAIGNVPFSFTVTALDPYNNTASGYAGTVHFTSTDGSATLPADSALTAGAGTFSATLRTGGVQTITAADAANSFLSGTSGSITVAAAAVGSNKVPTLSDWALAVLALLVVAAAARKMRTGKGVSPPDASSLARREPPA